MGLCTSQTAWACAVFVPWTGSGTFATLCPCSSLSIKKNCVAYGRSTNSPSSSSLTSQVSTSEPCNAPSMVNLFDPRRFNALRRHSTCPRMSCERLRWRRLKREFSWSRPPRAAREEQRLPLRSPDADGSLEAMSASWISIEPVARACTCPELAGIGSLHLFTCPTTILSYS